MYVLFQEQITRISFSKILRAEKMQQELERGQRASGWKPGVKMFSGSQPLFGCSLGAAHIQTSTCVLHSSAPFTICEPSLHAAGHLWADSLLTALKCVALLEK